MPYSLYLVLGAEIDRAESPKSRAWRVYVLACSRAWRACVLTGLACLRAYVLSVLGLLACLRAHMVGELLYSRA